MKIFAVNVVAVNVVWRIAVDIMVNIDVKNGGYFAMLTLQFVLMKMLPCVLYMTLMLP